MCRVLVGGWGLVERDMHVRLSIEMGGGRGPKIDTSCILHMVR